MERRRKRGYKEKRDRGKEGGREGGKEGKKEGGERQRKICSITGVYSKMLTRIGVPREP